MNCFRILLGKKRNMKKKWEVKFSLVVLGLIKLKNVRRGRISLNANKIQMP